MDSFLGSFQIPIESSSSFNSEILKKKVLNQYHLNVAELTFLFKKFDSSSED